MRNLTEQINIHSTYLRLTLQNSKDQLRISTIGATHLAAGGKFMVVLIRYAYAM